MARRFGWLAACTVFMASPSSTCSARRKRCDCWLPRPRNIPTWPAAWWPAVTIPMTVDQVVARLRRDYPDMGVYSSRELSFNVKRYWLFRSRGGTVLICTLVLALLVGLAVTSETLYAAVLAQAKEFAVLEALGIPRRHVVGLVLAQSFWLGVGGVLLALPCMVALARAALWVQTLVILSAADRLDYLRPHSGNGPAGRFVVPAAAAQHPAGQVAPLKEKVLSWRILPLSARRLVQIYGSGDNETHALRGVSLNLTPGQLTLVMGPSGCGKTTLMAVLSGLLPPTGGQVLFGGRDLYALSAAGRREFRRQHVGFIFQGYHLFPTLTVREQLEMVLRWGEGLPLDEAARRTQGLLEVLNLTRKADLFPLQLSGGEQQRVAIGRALIKKPRSVIRRRTDQRPGLGPRQASDGDS